MYRDDVPGRGGAQGFDLWLAITPLATNTKMNEVRF